MRHANLEVSGGLYIVGSFMQIMRAYIRSAYVAAEWGRSAFKQAICWYGTAKQPVFGCSCAKGFQFLTEYSVLFEFRIDFSLAQIVAAKGSMHLQQAEFTVFTGRLRVELVVTAAPLGEVFNLPIMQGRPERVFGVAPSYDNAFYCFDDGLHFGCRPCALPG